MNSALSNLRRVGGVIVTLWLMALHADLLWQRVVDGSLTDSRVVVRWLGAALLLFGLGVLRRSWRTNPHAVLVFWLLVILLHASVPVDDQLIVQGSIAVVSAGLLLTALLVASESGDRRLLFVVTPRQSAVFKPLAVLSVATRGPPAH